MINKLHASSLLLTILVVGAILRFSFLAVAEHYQEQKDWEYGAIARNIVQGNGFSRVSPFSNSLEPTSSHAPLYPYFLSLFYGFKNHNTGVLFVKLIQILISILTIQILYYISLKLFNKTAALVTAVLAALYPPLIYYSTKLTPTTIFIFLLSSTILLILKIENRSKWLPVGAGITLGLTLLCNPIAFTLLPALIIYWLINRTKPFKKYMLTLLMTTFMLIPWTLRNYTIHKYIIPVTNQFAINFWIGNNEYATGTDYYRVDYDHEKNYILMTETLPRKVKRELAGVSEIDRAKFFMLQGFKFIQKYPGKFIELFLKKILYFWWFPPAGIYGSHDANTHRNLYMIVYLPLLILGLAGIVLSLIDKLIDPGLIICFIFFTGLTYTITHVGLIRYRIPIEVYFIVFSSYPLYKLTIKRLMHQKV